MSKIWDQFRRNHFIPPFFFIWLVLGLLIMSVLKAQQNIRTNELPSTRFPELARAYVTEKKMVEKLEEEISRLRENNTRLENALATGTKEAQVLNDSLQEMKVLAGLVEVEGPGIEVILKDSTKKPQEVGSDLNLLNAYVIHDYDILRVVNELKVAGAEAIAVNGQRIVANSWIRCIGPVICVNDVKMASPFVIQAIGDPTTLVGALKTPGGVLTDLESTDPQMVRINTKERLVILPYTGSTKFRFAKPVPVNEEREPGEKAE